MKLRFFGAAGEVTGSNHMIDTKNYKVLVDCGTRQGRDEEKHEGESFPYNPADVSAVVLTHAHIDHSGKLPLLVKLGFKGKIYCTSATAELVDVLLRDSARIMQEDAEWKTRKNMRKGAGPVEPLYGEKDVDETMKHITALPYGQQIDLLPGFKVRLQPAGHILGSAIVEAWISEEAGQKPVKVVFSGDLGQFDRVIELPPTMIDEADFVLIESTYGDRLHKSLEDTEAEFEQVMKDALATSAKILIPTFVVDRAQRMLFELDQFEKKNQQLHMPPTYLDSPMGVKTTEIYRKYSELLQPKLRDMLQKGDDPFAPDVFQFVRTGEESRALNMQKSGIILAGSGMCSGGRIMHHLKHNLYKPDTHVIFVGYQAYGTLGRRLVDGEKDIRIAGEDVTVKAQIHTLNGFSAHADRDDLLKWAEHIGSGARFIVVHGEPKSSEALATGLRDKGFAATVPALGDAIDLQSTTQEIAKMPTVSPRLLDRITFNEQDITQTLAAIMSRASEMQKSSLADSDFKQIMPLLISARTLLETAGTLAGPAEKEEKKTA